MISIPCGTQELVGTPGDEPPGKVIFVIIGISSQDAFNFISSKERVKAMYCKVSEGVSGRRCKKDK